ncbi:MAG: PAS domain S-box protein [Gallionella sp.]|nr:PAS domain S-box protein [Gallionella sp.]
MSDKTGGPALAGSAEGIIELRRQEALLKTGALQKAIFDSANFSSIATDANGVIQIFNVGAERMLGYTALEVMNKITPADISDPDEVIARAAALSLELDTPITPGFEALVFKASRGIEDIYELTYIRRDGSRFPAVVSVTALRDDENSIIGYLLIGTDNTARKQAEEALRKAGALQKAIFDSANFSSIATDAKGVIQIFNVGAERMLGYTAQEVMNKITPADISDPDEVIARAAALSLELDTPITPGFEALVFKASRGIEDIYELTYIRRDGSRFPAVVSVTALRDDENAIIGYLLIGTDNTARKQIEAEKQRLLDIQEVTNKQLQQAHLTLQVSEEKLAVTLNSIGDAVIATDAMARVTLLNPLAERLTGWTQAQAYNRPVDEIFHIIHKETRSAATIPVMSTLELGTIHGLANHTVLISRDGSECDIADSCAPIRDRDNRVIGAVLVFRDVTGEYAIQQALRDSTALTQTILNTVADGIITIHAAGGIVETVNPAAERMFGYGAAQLVGQNVTRLIPAFEQDASSNGMFSIGQEREVTGTRQDGSIFPMEMVTSEMWLGEQRHLTCVLRDITTRRQTDEKLRWTEEGFRLMVESVTDYAIVMLDPSGHVVSWNSGAQRIIGYDAEEIIGQHFSRFYPGSDILRGEPQRDLSIVNAMARFEDESWRVRRDGSTFWANVVYTAIRDQDGNLRGYAKLTRDLTERKRQDQILLDNNTELAGAKLLAEKANLAKSIFLSKMSHELRTPLNAILGFAQLLEIGSPPPTETQVLRLHQIIKAGWYLLELINEILDLAVIESGRLSLSREPVSLAEVMRECQAMIESQAQQHAIKINFRPFDASLFANADRTRVKQVLINLLSNAIKYNREQGTVEVVCTVSSPDRVRISIRDSGEGLPPEKLLQLFQPFNRLGQENGSEEGTGIGLVVTKQLIELMGGSISVKSIVGVGSEFSIELIRDVTPELADGHPMPPPVAAQVHGDTAQHTLLYVEDNPANMMLVEQIIAGHPQVRMLCARDANLGIALARAHLPDVILMDINLPGISGIEALHILHKDAATAHIPVIALSANAMLRDIEKGLEAGFFRYLTKPIKINEFMNALDDALKCSEVLS